MLLVDLLMSIPAHSTDCGRGFSLLKIIKTDCRNRLTADAVTNLMRIHLEAADIKQYNPDDAVLLWNKAVVPVHTPNQHIWEKNKS